jgi:Na+-transporting NADH:ubiquinone oxidoreductase subunit C
MKKSILSILYMFLISVFFSALVSVVKILSEKKITANQERKLQRIILQVLDIQIPDVISGQELSRFFGQRIKILAIKDKTFYIAYEKDGKTLKGYAFPVGGPGFWGPIQGMVAVDPQAESLLGLAFYKHSETPGLGGRLAEDWFTGQFKGLPLFPIEGEKNIFYLRPEGDQKKANELDAITGATNTSSAIENFLNKELDYFLKELWGLLEEEI